MLTCRRSSSGVVLGLTLATWAALSTGASAQSADLIVKEVRVYSTKADGKHWDAFGGAPDLKVRLSGAGSYTTRTVQDSYAGIFNETAFRVSPGDRLFIQVIDEDAFADDTAGSTSYTVTGLDIANGSVVLRNFGQVQYLYLSFRPVANVSNRIPLPQAAGPMTVYRSSGYLSSADASDNGGHYYQMRSVYLVAGDTYVIDLTSSDLDSYLILQDGNSNVLMQDDDGGEGLNSRIVYRPTQSGTYWLRASSFGAYQSGSYQLTVQR